MQTESNLFLSTVFAEKPENLFILIWIKTSDKKLSYWFQQPEDVQIDLDFEKNADIYFGVGLSPTAYRIYERCKEKDIAGLFGLWTDLDIKDGIHKKTNLPPTIDDALALIEQMPFKPSIIVSTGGGLQTFWLFKKLWIFEDNLERERAIELSAKWTYKLKELAASYGWDIDSTQDLSRVMRVPGTFNHKGPEPRPVEIMEWSDRRYDVLELAEAVEGIQIPTSAAKSRQEPSQQAYKPDFDIEQVQAINFEKWDILCDLNPKLRQTFNHKRKDFIDQSCSIYDLALAAMLKFNEWNDQEIVDFLIYHRKKYGDPKTDQKGELRIDYYNRTLDRVYRMITPEEIPAEIWTEQLAEDQETAPAVHTVEAFEQRRADTLHKISLLLNLPIKALVRVHAEPVYFRLELENEESVNLGGTAQLTNQNIFRARICDVTLNLIPKKTKAQWDALLKQLIDPKVITEDFPDPVETKAGFITKFIPIYLGDRPPVEDTDPQIYLEWASYLWREATYIQFSGFQDWLKRKDQDLKKLSHEGLRAAGFVSENRSIRRADGGTTSVTGWKVPDYLL